MQDLHLARLITSCLRKQTVGAMLDILEISSYSGAFLKDVLERLETRQVIMLTSCFTWRCIYFMILSSKLMPTSIC
jgi:hypothetical protein